MIDFRSLVRGVVLQALYELDCTAHSAHPPVMVAPLIPLNDDHIRFLAYWALRRRFEQLPDSEPRAFELPLKKKLEHRSPVEQVLIDALTEGRNDEDIADDDTAEIEVVVEVPDLEELDPPRWVDESLFPLSYQQQALQLIKQVWESRQELDSMIQQHAPEHPIDQLAIVDRNILRVAFYEILHSSRRVPVRPIINEAVELAKIFGAESSPRFVNGVLGAFLRIPEETA